MQTTFAQKYTTCNGLSEDHGTRITEANGASTITTRAQTLPEK